MNLKSTTDTEYRPWALALGPVVALGAYLATFTLPFGPDVDPTPARMAAAVTGLVATYWLTNAVHLAAASLIPIAAMPALGVLPIDQVAPAFAHPIIWMFFGGFILALGVERWHLHHRIALGIIQRIGVTPSRLVLGFMLAAGFLSMWMNNTAMTLLLLPIGIALIDSMEKAGAVSGPQKENFSFALLMGIAYACSIGGIGTPIGTAPNALFLTNYAPFEKAGAPPVTFLLWMVAALPIVIALLPITWALLCFVLAPLGQASPQAKAVIDAEAKRLPRMSTAEVRMLCLFGLAALLWTTRRDFELGEWGTLPGWWRLLPVKSAAELGDGAVAIFVAVLSFLIPSGRRKGEALMNWSTARHLPWDILLLIGGGIAIARAFSTTGLAEAVGRSLEPWLSHLPPVGIVLMVCLMMTFLTEVTSNTATTALLLPVLASAALAVGLDPRLLMLPATLSASCAFMLPIATPPNAIVFSSGHIPMLRMAKTGLVLNVIGACVITAILWLWSMPAWNIEPTQVPAWLQAMR